MFAESYQDYLRKYIELKNGIPSHDTIRHVMGMISPEILQQLYGKWQERLDKNDGELLKKIICIDGKTMRSNKRGEEKASHVVSAWSKEDGFCLGQKAVGEKSNEITAIPELPEKIQIKGQIITIDAMGTQTAIAEKIRQKRAVRGHWSIESMHWHLDVTFREDANTTLDKMAAQNLNIIRKRSLSILKPAEISRHKLSIRKKRFVVSLRPIKYLEELLEV